MSPSRLLALLLIPALGLAMAMAGPGEAPVPLTPITDRYEKIATLDIPVEEVSGLAVLPGATKTQVDLLLVTDEGPYDREKHEVRGALFRQRLHFGADEIRHDAPVPVTLKIRLDRFDPAWPEHTSCMDLESLAPLPGTDDLYVMTGERNPEDQTDDGANRIYVMRYPDGDEKSATVLQYFRVFDLPFDGMNDRFEGCAVRPLRKENEGITWQLYGFKERMPVEGKVPPYARGTLKRRGGTFTLAFEGDRGYPPLIPSRYADQTTSVSQQSGACAGPDGAVWVLDRWRRQVHVTKPGKDGALELREHLDLWTVVKDIPGEVNPSRPPPPGLPERKGYGRHEAIGFDPHGRLYLASDRGGGSTSTVTVLRPRVR